MRWGLLLVVLALSGPASAAEPVRDEVLRSTPQVVPATRYVGATVFGLGAATFVASAAVLATRGGDDRIGWGLMLSSAALAGVGQLIFDAD